MSHPRRNFLQTSAGTVIALALASGLLRPARAATRVVDGADTADWRAAAFAARSLPGVLEALGLPMPVEDARLVLQAPAIADNGAVVPVTLACTLPGVRRLAVLVEKNPATLAALFELSAGVLPQLTTRIKLAETSQVYGLAETADGLFYAHQVVKVTLGGCGG